MDNLDLINKLENDLILLKEAERKFQVELCQNREKADDSFWNIGAEISRTIISTRKALAEQKLEAGNYPYHMDTPPRIGCQE